jgi:predicted SprT family Zn-dependent metalloprotease
VSSTIKLKFLVLKIQLVIKAWHCVWWLIRIIPLWGRCSPHGRITLNPHLVKASRECIDYVILHELCYIAEHNHSESFRLMSQVMPGWEKTKERLDGMAARLLA